VVSLTALAALPPGEDHPLAIGQETEWALKPVWTRWRRERNPIIAPARNRTPIFQHLSRWLTELPIAADD
jgi:hypothetical protein